MFLSRIVNGLKKTLGSRLLFRTGFDLQDYYLAVKFSLGKKKFRFKMMRC